MKYIIPELSKQDSNCDSLHNEDGQRGALIMCLRRSRVLGQLKNNKHVDHGIKDKWCGIVDVKLLQQALNCKDEQIRLDALALLCENQKTTEVIEETEFQLIRNFIPSNLTNQNPAFRQHFLSLLKKFLNRMKESSCSILKKVDKDKTCVIIQNMYKDFLCWLTRCLFNCLYPGSVFARRSTSLEGLSLLMKMFYAFIPGVPSELQYNFYLEVTSSDITSLLFCITDSFEDIKNMAANLLIACTRHPTSVNMDYEERLFDRGEINTYWDEFDFIQRLDKTIDDNKEILMSKITQDTEVDQQIKDWDNNCDRNEVPTLRTMFLDTHNYQDYVLMILKHSIAHKYKHMMMNLGYNIEDKCFKLLKDGQDWKSAESHYILPSVLVQQMKKT